jgi:hypothetical protein
LRIRICTDEINTVNLSIHHMLDRVTSTAAHTDDFNDRMLR